jgi:hypothetical protein
MPDCMSVKEGVGWIAIERITMISSHTTPYGSHPEDCGSGEREEIRSPLCARYPACRQDAHPLSESGECAACTRDGFLYEQLRLTGRGEVDVEIQADLAEWTVRAEMG